MIYGGWDGFPKCLIYVVGVGVGVGVGVRERVESHVPIRKRGSPEQNHVLAIFTA